MAFSSIFNMWNKWNIRGIVVLSLSLQVFLILVAPLRKKVANPYIISLLWSAYLMADWVATFGIGLISHSHNNWFAHAAEVDIALQAFWASFLLLHLGGPDTITAFSLEDSSLWRRHLFSLIFQVYITIYVFVQIFPIDKSLVIPTTLVFLAGVIKNVERIIALYLSSLPRLKEVMSLWNLGRRKASVKLTNALLNPDREVKLVESIAVKHAHCFFKIFKVFLLDLFCKDDEDSVSRKYFSKVSAVDALRVISIELHFMYEMLHTKVLAMRSKWSYIFRFIAFTEVTMAFVLFNRFKKHELPKLDVEITYILLFGGIAIDMIALFILVLSDWTVTEIMQLWTGSSKLNSFLRNLISTTYDRREPQYTKYKVEPTANATHKVLEPNADATHKVLEPNADATYEVLDTGFIFKRWTESISGCSIFSELREESPRKMRKCDQCWGIAAFSDICSLPFHKAEKIITSCFHGTRAIVVGRESAMLLDIPRYTSNNPFINKVWIYIFDEMKRKSELKDETEISEARGNMFLLGKLGETGCDILLEHVTKVAYDSSVIIWHVATEILYDREKSTGRNDEKEFSKILSDYLLYLFLKQPRVVSAVAGFAKLKFVRVLEILRQRPGGAKNVEILVQTMDHNIKDSNPSSPLWQGILLARKLENIGERKWEVMSGVWVEMLSYAAGHIKGEAHAQVLSKGGEFLTFVWLLMAHFGYLYKPEWGSPEDMLIGPNWVTPLRPSPRISRKRKKRSCLN